MIDRSNMKYSDNYENDKYIFRHIIIVPRFFRADKLLSEYEWRKLGVRQSRGWEHYLIYEPEPNILLFRKLK